MAREWEVEAALMARLNEVGEQRQETNLARQEGWRPPTWAVEGAAVLPRMAFEMLEEVAASVHLVVEEALEVGDQT